MTSKAVGLIDKYRAQRIDRKPITDGCLVLEFTDPNCRPAISTFADTVRAQGWIVLADDIDKKLAKYTGKK